MQKDHFKVHRGEPGCNIVTPLRDELPLIENPPEALASPSSSSLPSLTWEQNEGKALILSPRDEVANFRFVVVNIFNEESAKENRPKAETVRNEVPQVEEVRRHESGKVGR